jgi:PD-(D/E)XK endonuclease
MSKKQNPGMYKGGYIKNGKKRGEWAELCFAAKGMKQGLTLARPWGESNGYDFVVDRGPRGMVRVQVKSTIFPEGTGYSCSLKDSKGPYKQDSFDFVAAYVIPEDLWFILPEKIVRGLWSIGLYPNLPSSKYFEYKEAWHYLRETQPTTIDSLQASAEENDEEPAALTPQQECQRKQMSC